MEKNKIISGILLCATFFSVTAGICTIIPWGLAEEANKIGYKSICSFSPISTIICLMAANTFYGIRKKKFL